MKKYSIILVVAAVILIGFALRFNTMLAERDMWYDEAFSGILLRQDWPQMNQMIFDDVHPPLYYWLTKPWSQVFGYDPAGIRSFSVFASLILIFSVYWVGKKMFNKKAGLLAGAITALSPFAVQYSQEARMYVIFALFMLWATWFFLKALKKNQWKDWALWAVFAGLAFYSHYLSLFFFIIYFIAFVWYQKSFNKKSFWKAALGTKKFWAGVGIIFLFFLTWLKFFIPHMLKGNLGWIGKSHLSDIPSTLQIFLFGHPPGSGGVPVSNEFRYFFDGSSAGLAVLAVMIALAVWAWMKGKKKKEIFVLSVLSFGTLIFLIIASHFNIKLYVSRYFMPAAVMIYILLAGLITLKWPKRGWAYSLILFCLLVISLKPIPYNTDWYQTSQYIKQNFADTGAIVTPNPFAYTSIRYYFSEEVARYYNKANPTEDFSGWVVVGNKNRLDSPAQIKNLEKPVIVDYSCDWEGIETEEVKKIGELSVCQIK